jgi:hypothetical protein
MNTPTLHKSTCDNTFLRTLNVNYKKLHVAFITNICFIRHDHNLAFAKYFRIHI